MTELELANAEIRSLRLRLTNAEDSIRYWMSVGSQARERIIELEGQRAENARLREEFDRQWQIQEMEGYDPNGGGALYRPQDLLWDIAVRAFMSPKT